MVDSGTASRIKVLGVVFSLRDQTASTKLNHAMLLVALLAMRTRRICEYSLMSGPMWQ